MSKKQCLKIEDDIKQKENEKDKNRKEGKTRTGV